MTFCFLLRSYSDIVKNSFLTWDLPANMFFYPGTYQSPGFQNPRLTSQRIYFQNKATLTREHPFIPETYQPTGFRKVWDLPANRRIFQATLTREHPVKNLKTYQPTRGWSLIIFLSVIFVLFRILGLPKPDLDLNGLPFIFFLFCLSFGFFYFTENFGNIPTYFTTFYFSTEGLFRQRQEQFPHYTQTYQPTCFYPGTYQSPGFLNPRLTNQQIYF